MNLCWFNLKRVTIIAFTLNLILTTITLLIFFHEPKKSSSKDIHPNQRDQTPLLTTLVDNQEDWVDAWGPGFEDTSISPKLPQDNVNSSPISVEIWSKAAIGLYLWEEIIKGTLDRNLNNGMYIVSSKRVKNVKFNFRTGPALSIDSLRSFVSDPSQVKNLIVILNARDSEKMQIAKSWLDELKIQAQLSTKPSLQVGVIMLGNENCFNSWILPYLASNGGFIKFLFITYDWKMVNDEDIFQWPLGIATYRSFPVPSLKEIKPQFDRPYVCNFLGTVYPNTSREELVNVVEYLNNNSVKFIGRNSNVCLVKGRSSWWPSETPQSLAMYVDSLRLSDLTLCPVGMNHESYRIWESISYGSIPVLEENLSHVKYPRSSCDQSTSYRLLKKYQAPVLFVANWTNELTSLITREASTVTHEEKIQRRTQLIDWYKQFKSIMRDELIDAIDTKFQHHSFSSDSWIWVNDRCLIRHSLPINLSHHSDLIYVHN